MKLKVLQVLEPHTSQTNFLYKLTNTKRFIPGNVIDCELVLKTFNFAYENSFGNNGSHTDSRRKNGERFANAFQGKLTEFAFWNELTNHSIYTNEPDLTKAPNGKSDIAELEFNHYNIAIKSTKSYGQLLLLDTDHWNEEAQYQPYKDSGHTKYDFIVLVRIKPHISDLLKKHRLLYANQVNKDILMEIVCNRKFEYDIPGFITHDDLQTVIAQQQIIPKGTYINKFDKRNKVNADTYYIQTGNLRSMSEFGWWDVGTGSLSQGIGTEGQV